LVGSLGGIAITLLVVFAASDLTLRLERHRMFFDLPGLRWVLGWILLLGLLLGAVVTVSRRYPPLVVLPAVLLGLGYTLASPFGPWPEAVASMPGIRWLWSGFGPATLLLVGAFLVAAGGRIETNGGQGGRSTRVLLQGAGGAILAVALLRGLDWLTIRYIESTVFLEVTEARWAMFGLVLLGAVIGVLVLISRRLPWLTVTTAAVWGLLFLAHPGMLGAGAPWTENVLPDALRADSAMLPPTIPLMIGMLVGASATGLIPQIAADNPRNTQPDLPADEAFNEASI
jgi:hypothetical protein